MGWVVERVAPALRGAVCVGFVGCAHSAAGPSVSVDVSGPPDGQPVLLVHGTPGSSDTWSRLVKAAPPGLRVLAMDRPGFGESPPRGAEPRLEAQARAVGSLLGAPEGPGTILVGHSLGGAVVVAAALEYPKHVKGIVIIAGALDPDLEKTLWIQRVAAWPLVRHLLPRFLRNANEELLAYEAELRVLAGRVAELRCPVIVIHGTEDSLVPFENVAYMQRAFSGTRVEIVALEGQGHGLPWSAEETIWQQVLALAEQALW